MILIILLINVKNITVTKFLQNLGRVSAPKSEALMGTITPKFLQRMGTFGSYYHRSRKRS